MFALTTDTPTSLAAERRSANQSNEISAGTEQYVQIANAKVRETPKHWGKGILDVSYGTPLTVLSAEGGWLKVQSANGAQGYIHQAALTSRKVAFASGSTAVQIRPDESDVVLAGKGFSAEIESSYRESHKELNFDAVDQMEKLVPTDREVSLFVTEGKLRE